MGRAALTTAVAILALLPAGAAAGVRFASPDGAGDCSQLAPCSLATAVSGAMRDDEVVVEAGEHRLTGTLQPPVPMSIHGTPGQPRPRIVGPPGGAALDAAATLTLSDVTLESKDAGFTAMIVGPGSTAERIEVIASAGTGTQALRPGDGFVLRNSLLRSHGTDAVALFYQATETNRVTLRNVTAFASGTGSVALAIFATEPAPSATIDATNVIAEAQLDASATAHPASSAAINFFSSNFSSGTGGVGGGGNQVLPPRFANAAAGDFRQAPGSPTIDAGLTDPVNGALDLDGNVRTAGAATDIGAYESSPGPPAGTPVDASAAGTIIGTLRLSRRGVVTATLTCPASESRCAWSYRLRSRKRVRTRGKRRVITFGGGTAAAGGGRRVTVRIRLSKRNFRLIRSKRRLSVKLTVRTTDAAANVATTKRTSTLRAPRR